MIVTLHYLTVLLLFMSGSLLEDRRVLWRESENDCAEHVLFTIRSFRQSFQGLFMPLKEQNIEFICEVSFYYLVRTVLIVIDSVFVCD